MTELEQAIETHECPRCGGGLCNIDYTPSKNNEPREQNDLIYCSVCEWEAVGFLKGIEPRQRGGGDDSISR